MKNLLFIIIILLATNIYANDRINILDDLVFKDTFIIDSEPEALFIKPLKPGKLFMLGNYYERFSNISLNANLTSIMSDRISLNVSKHLSIKLSDSVDSQAYIWLPATPGGEKKYKCAIWFDIKTKTIRVDTGDALLLFEPITCGGIK